jgi:hypothetical protein
MLLVHQMWTFFKNKIIFFVIFINLRKKIVGRFKCELWQQPVNSYHKFAIPHDDFQYYWVSMMFELESFFFRASLAMNPMRPSATFFFHPDGEKWPSRAPGSSFSSWFGPSSIRQAQTIPSPPGHARGLRTREKRGRAYSVGKRHPDTSILHHYFVS